MPRPSQRIDLALLQSGRALFPSLGCAGLTVRAVAEHAGVGAGMFHYHFKTKDDFLRALLQQEYDAMFESLGTAAAAEGSPVSRLRGALIHFAGFVRDQRSVFARLLTDAWSGQPVAAEFMQRNAPRHVGLVLGLLGEADRAGALRPLHPLQRFVMLMGAVAIPVVVLPGLVEAVITDRAFRQQFDAKVMSDEGIAERVDLMLAALCRPGRAPRRRSKEKP